MLGTTLPAWLDFSTLRWISAVVVGLGAAGAVLGVAKARGAAAKVAVLALMVAVMVGVVHYRSTMETSRRTCSTTLFDAHVRTPGCPIH
jgi:hypothetical protein